MLTELTKGVRVVSPIATIVAAGNPAAQVLFTPSTSVLQIGTKSYKLKKLMIRDNGTGGSVLHFGTGAAGAVVDAIPPITTVNAMDLELEEDELPEVELFAISRVWASVVGASTINVQAVVEEIG